MNPFEMVVMIVFIVMVASVLRSALGGGRRRRLRHGEDETPALSDGEARMLREEVTRLRERVIVLERIATDKNHLLEQEFERLRDER